MADDSFLQFSTDEQAIIKHVQLAEDFRYTAWAQYGEDWTDHIPANVNAFVWYYFRTLLFRWHLAMYYCPMEIKEITVHGGRAARNRWVWCFRRPPITPYIPAKTT